MLTIRKVLSLVKESSEVTTIHVASGLYSPSTTGELFPITIPDNVHLIGAGWENTIIDIEAMLKSKLEVLSSRGRKRQNSKFHNKRWFC